jgi:hypothetical protein
VTTVPPHIFCAGMLLTAAIVNVGSAGAQELEFAPVAEARRLLSARDAFVERMSAFDRAARMKTDRAVAESEFLQFAASAALDWEEDETRSVAAAYREIRDELNALRLPLPPEIVFIKTTGQEEGNAGYTRENAIVLPRRLLGSSSAELQKLLAHELFHIASRASPALAPLLYEAIGFRPCGEAEFPESLTARKITNPDAPRNDYCIRVMLGGEEVSATPILFSRTDTYDGARGGEFFEYLQLALLLRTEPAPETTEAPAPRVVGLRDVSGFFEQVGRNTQYIIHPEEILADNFALLVLAPTSVASPEVLARVRDALASFPAAPRTGPGAR